MAAFHPVVILNSFQDPFRGLLWSRRNGRSGAAGLELQASARADGWMLKQVQHDGVCHA